MAIRPFIKIAARPERTSATAAGATSSPVASTSRNPSSDRPNGKVAALRVAVSSPTRIGSDPTPAGDALGQGLDNRRNHLSPAADAQETNGALGISFCE